MIKGRQLASKKPTRLGFIKNLRQVSSYDAGGILPSPLTFNPLRDGGHDPHQWLHLHRAAQRDEVRGGQRREPGFCTLVNLYTVEDHIGRFDHGGGTRRCCST
jgi:hypothetical protein